MPARRPLERRVAKLGSPHRRRFRPAACCASAGFGILARARALVRIAARLDLAVQVARLAARRHRCARTGRSTARSRPRSRPNPGRCSPRERSPCRSVPSIFERISKSCGRKRRALPPQCAAVPPTISPGLNEPISRIGSAVWLGLLRKVIVSRDRFWKMSLCRSYLSSSCTYGATKSVCGSIIRPRSRQSTFEPGVRELHGHDRAYDAAAHDHRVDRFHFHRRHVISPLPASA